jgi:hypothetical protein
MLVMLVMLFSLVFLCPSIWLNIRIRVNGPETLRNTRQIKRRKSARSIVDLESRGPARSPILASFEDEMLR